MNHSTTLSDTQMSNPATETPKYGTVAKMMVKPGQAEALQKLMTQHQEQIPGIVQELVFRADNEPDTYYLAVVFASKEAYLANAQHPEQHQRYLEYRELLTTDPEWHDGEVIWQRDYDAS